MNPESFRALFPALRSQVWLDTPGSPPGATPIVEALRRTIDSWSSGDFEWLEWDAAADRTRRLFGQFIGAPAATVSTVGSLAEAVAIVAGSIPRGRVVIAEQDFRSNRFPWLAKHEVITVPARHGETRVEDLVGALDETVTLVAVSEITSREGQRIDLRELRAATNRVGAQLFVNLTQSLGALRFDPTIAPDYLALHGYKWMLCPRGAAWLVTREDRVAGLTPLSPGWKSTPTPHGYFGGGLELLAADAARCDASPAWFPWVGAEAALGLLNSLDQIEVENHVLELSGRLLDEARAFGYRRVVGGARSHIAVLATDKADKIAASLAEAGVRATALGDRVRFGFHYFNDDSDVTAALKVLASV